MFVFAQVAAYGQSGEKTSSLELRQFAAVAHDTKDNQFVLFGGTYGYARFDDTWIFDSSGWKAETPKNFPAERVLAAAAYDSGHSEVLLFGGRVKRTSSPKCTPAAAVELLPAEFFCGDTWVFDGKNWASKAPKHSPPAREGQGMAYDVARKKVVLFGGNGKGGTLPYGDTWVWNGSDWTELKPAHHPQARAGQTMAYDPVHGEVVLFGGNDSKHMLNDTWVWNGNDWTKKNIKTVIPPVRTDAGMDYDSVSKKMVLFSGFEWSAKGVGTPTLDAWTWNGTQWAQLKSSQFKLFTDFAGLTPNDRVHALVANGTPSSIWVPVE